jgi:hypothetical protein
MPLRSLAAVLALRTLYIVRFGWDPGWMNQTYLSHAKGLALQGSAGGQPPFIPLVLVAMRRLGLSAIGALELFYLAAHLLLAYGTIALAELLWPDMSRRRRMVLAAVIALVPLASTIAGYRNLGPLVGAALTTAALACALRWAEGTGSALDRLLIAPLAIAASLTRFESIATLMVGGLALLSPLARRGARFISPRRAALVLLLATLIGAATHSAFERPRDPSSKIPSYAFYTFYDGLPYLMWPDRTKDSDEFSRYNTSVSYFGSLEENRGSVLLAMVRHPALAFLRLALKPIDGFAILLWIGSLSPLGVVLLVLGLRRIDRAMPSFARGSIIAAAYLGAIVVLLVPIPAPPYYLAVAPPLILAITRGIDRVLVRFSERATKRIFVGSAITGTLSIVFLGRLDVANSPVLNAAAADLEERCARGCLANYLPQSMRNQAWVDLEAGALFPKLDDDKEIVGRKEEAFERGYRFEERARRAKSEGYRGPILYVQVKVASFAAYHPDFDRVAGYEGPIDPARMMELRRFESGDDLVVIYAIR